MQFFSSDKRLEKFFFKKSPPPLPARELNGRPLSRRPWLFWISQKLNLIIVLLYIEREKKMVRTMIGIILSFFSLSRNQQTAPSLPPSSTFLCFVSPSLQLFFDVLLDQRSKPGSQCFCFFTDGKHKARELDVIMTHSPYKTLSVGPAGSRTLPTSISLVPNQYFSR